MIVLIADLLQHHIRNNMAERCYSNLLSILLQILIFTGNYEIARQKHFTLMFTQAEQVQVTLIN